LGALSPQSWVNGLRNLEGSTYGGWGGMCYKVDGFENVYAHEPNARAEKTMEWALAFSVEVVFLPLKSFQE
jgi:hypothetical protein